MKKSELFHELYVYQVPSYAGCTIWVFPIVVGREGVKCLSHLCTLQGQGCHPGAFEFDMKAGGRS